MSDENSPREFSAQSRWLFQREARARRHLHGKTCKGEESGQYDNLARRVSAGWCARCGIRPPRGPDSETCRECSALRGGERARKATGKVVSLEQRRTPAHLRLLKILDGALSRGIQVDIDTAWISDRLSCPCAYCGGDVEPWSCGVDRVDPEIGYTVGNSVPCCSWCNKAKLTLTGDEWRRVIGPAVAKLGAGNVWPSKRPSISDAERSRRKDAIAAAAVSRGVHALARWAVKVVSLDEAAAVARVRSERAAAGLHPLTGIPLNEMRNERERGWHRQRVLERASAGLCVKCGDRPPAEGAMRCEVCRPPRKQASQIRNCHVCGCEFSATELALKRTCSDECRRKVANWRTDLKKAKRDPGWPQWKIEMWDGYRSRVISSV